MPLASVSPSRTQAMAARPGSPAAVKPRMAADRWATAASTSKRAKASCARSNAASAASLRRVHRRPASHSVRAVLRPRHAPATAVTGAQQRGLSNVGRVGMTMAEKILARTSGRDSVVAGEYVTARPDVLMATRRSPPAASPCDGWASSGWPTPTASTSSSTTPCRRPRGDGRGHAYVRSPVDKYGIDRFYDLGGGICHQVMSRRGHVEPGQLVSAPTRTRPCTARSAPAAPGSAPPRRLRLAPATCGSGAGSPPLPPARRARDRPSCPRTSCCTRPGGTARRERRTARSSGIEGAAALSVESRMTMADWRSDRRIRLLRARREDFAYLEEHGLPAAATARRPRPRRPLRGGPRRRRRRVEPQVACPTRRTTSGRSSELRGKRSTRPPRLLHQRPPRGPARSLPIPARQDHRPARPHVRLPGLSEVYRQAMRGACSRASSPPAPSSLNPGCGACFGRHSRPPGRPRGVHLLDQPQLPGAHGVREARSSWPRR